MSDQSTPPLWPPFIWHHRVHKDKRGERLFYWRAKFTGAYERDRVAAGIQAACDRRNVKSVIVYELFGAYDVLIRVWLPRDGSITELDQTLTAELAPARLEMWDSFEVDCMVRHWPFAGSKGSTNSPEEHHVTHLQDSEIEEVEAGWPDVKPELRERLTKEHLIAPLEVDSQERPGIKFAIEVSGDEEIDARGLADCERQLTEIIDRASSITQRSLYSGFGFAHFLIMGRIDYDEFHAIHSDLVSKINTGPISEQYGIRTLTHISGQRGYRIAREGLSGSSGGARSRVGAFLQRRLLTPASSDRALQPGETIDDRFEIIEHIGRGGYADVYAALDHLEEVKRAIKVFKSANGDVVWREMSALRRVNHPNVVKAIWGDHDGRHWYLVSEFIEGESLDECEPGDDLWALSVVIEVLEALEAVHPDDSRIAELRAKEEVTTQELFELQRLEDRGLIHRDVKPSNIMVGEDGHITLVDFNIASPARQTSMTRSGTPAYMAPDAGYGGWEPSDDLFSVGVVLYELLLGSHPFPGGTPISGSQPIDPSSIRSDLPASLVELLVRACQTIRSDRYQSAREMRSDLKRELDKLNEINSSVRRALSQLKIEQALPDPSASDPDAAESARRDREKGIELVQSVIELIRRGPQTSDPDRPAGPVGDQGERRGGPQAPPSTGNGDRQAGEQDEADEARDDDLDDDPLVRT